MDKIEKVIGHLVNRESDILLRKYKDHTLKGPLKEFIELHTEGDWLLMYQINNDILELVLLAAGSPDHVFK
ncbi:type II toxin-antitoxin system RelE/ParE family toxin [Enterococcus sp. AZ109]|uniref:type II toxin-antitoxin system RelE/ParE family toxin n=1 Tax=Enterococcus sp. AZ109 TaxID=2774634 RepID=UPI003F685910